MRFFLAVAALASTVAYPAPLESPSAPCGFRVTSDAAGPPSIIGPDWFVPLVYVQNQPDSPLEVASIDFDKTDLKVTPASYAGRQDYILRVHNRSDRSVVRFDVAVRMVPAAHLPGSPFSFLTTGGFQPKRGPIGAGQTLTIRYQSGSGNATDPAPNGAQWRVVPGFDVIEFDDCYYRPSVVLPKALR